EGERARVSRLAQAVFAAGPGVVQLRAKTVSTGVFEEVAATLCRDAAACGCALIVNDRCDVALATGAAGVHLGDEDLDPRQARLLLGAKALIGYSTHSLEDVQAAAALPVDYIGFGPVLESPTKPGVRRARGFDALAAACRAAVQPVVAIGGLTLGDAERVWRAGATSVAVISELERTRDPAATLREFLRRARTLGPAG
ncbi:MAG: thiamine phosphate synthase, partial [Deltaproteobacteria bacterium]